MKKLLLSMLLFSGIVHAQIINIPDANFKASLIVNGCDGNSDGEVEVAEAEQIFNLDVSGAGITDMTGIEAFVNLSQLICSGNPITSLDLSPCTALAYLIADDCPLSSINLTGLNALYAVQLSNNNLTSLTMNGYPELHNLQLENCNSLTSISATNCPAMYSFFVQNCVNLQTVDASDNLTLHDFVVDGDTALQSIDISNCPDLWALLLMEMPVTSLDITNCPALQYLLMQNVALTSMDVTPFPELIQFSFSSINPITDVNISGLTHLEYVYIGAGQITSLDLSGVTGPTQLIIDDNLLTTLDISQCTGMTSLEIGDNPITTMNLKNGRNEAVSFDLIDLEFVCADEGQISDVLAHCYPETVVNSYCSFTPGGPYNTITGTVKFDDENNGCDAGDVTQQFVKLTVTDGVNNYVTFDNQEGIYNFHVQSGNFNLAPSIENPTFFTISPSFADVNFPLVDNSVSANDFCIAPNGVHPDVEIVIAPSGTTPAPGFTSSYVVVYKNKGNQILSGAVHLSFDDNVLDFEPFGLVPDAQAIGDLTWNYTNLLPFESRRFLVYFNLNAPTDTPPLNSGDILNYSIDVTSVAGDEMPSDNVFAISQTVVNSFDPNKKICLEGNVVSPDLIGNFLHYMINFENLGTAPAVNIVVRDTLDVSKFDLTTLQVMGSSHPVTVRMTGNVAEFIFQDINLEIGGHGNILLKVKTREDLTENDVVSNRADIYFDYNHPIDTGYASTAFQELSVGEHHDGTIAVWPNPAAGIIHISAASDIGQVQLYDVQGRILQSKLPGESAVSLDLSDRQSGIYFVKVITETGFAVEKIIKN